MVSVDFDRNEILYNRGYRIFLDPYSSLKLSCNTQIAHIHIKGQQTRGSGDWMFFQSKAMTRWIFPAVIFIT